MTNTYVDRMFKQLETGVSLSFCVSGGKGVPFVFGVDAVPQRAKTGLFFVLTK